MRNHVRFAAAFVITLCSISGASNAQYSDPIPPSPIAKTELLVDAARVKTGQPIWAGVTFTLPDHWHIYWQNPGDSGIPTSFAWTLPNGLTAGAIEWPTPDAIEVGGLVNYGYSNQVTLPVKLMPTHDRVSGDVEVKATWLVCRDVCIPESAVLKAPLKSNPQAALTLASARTRAPAAFTGAARYEAGADGVVLQLTNPAGWGQMETAQFIPADDGIIPNRNTPNRTVENNILKLAFPRGSADAVAQWHGILKLTMADGSRSAFAIRAENHSPLVATPAAASSNPTSFILALGLAFLGGLILNIMPCVLPILALKALALSKKAQASRAAAARQGVAYTVGVVGSFLAIAGIMLALKASGAAIGWGFQLQNPAFVGVLALVMVLVAANLLGLFGLPVLFGARATGVDENSLRGSLLTGGLAVLVATPCTAPFMATAVGVTLGLPTLQALVVFAVLGLGMAAPFLLISLWPAARRLLPKPGMWMHRFKQFLAIPMLATAAWLVWVLVQIMHPTPMETTAQREPYSAARLAALRADGKPVIVDATAAWCLTCKVNARVALHPQEMQAFFREKNVTQMVADWTRSDPAITAYLAEFGRNGVPLVVYYPPHMPPVVLPQILSPTIVRDAIEFPNSTH